MKKARLCGLGALVLLWAALTAAAWFGPENIFSDAERRNLARFPEISGATVLSGRFMSEFETYTLDQFPLRDSFRQLKALFHYNALGQKDNNGIYISGGYAEKQEYPLQEASVRRAASRFEYLYKKYLADTESAVYMAVVPDKGQYLADRSGNLKPDIQKMTDILEEQMPWAEHIDLSAHLSALDYYRTDTHWRQERLQSVADALCEAMSAEKFSWDDCGVQPLERPFYGVYYGQAALPMEPDTMRVLDSDLLNGCVTSLAQIDMKTGQVVYEKLYDGVYDPEGFAGKDMYEGFLSGTQGVIRIDNPNSRTDRELILIRDSFASSVAPLLMEGYKSVTLVDIRAVQIDMLDQFLDFEGQDVLFLFSALVLNNSSTIK